MYASFPARKGGRELSKLKNYFSLSQYVKILVYSLLFKLTVNVNKLPKATHLLRWLLRRGSPLPIPNRVVKPACADGTAICGRVCHRLSFENPSSNDEGFFVLV